MNQEKKSIVHKVIVFFDKLEDNVRGHLSHYPIVYTIIGGVAIVLFWRGVWHTADILEQQGGVFGIIFSAPINLVLTILVLLVTGLFVSYFIGDTIMMSGLKHQKKVTDQTERDVEEEEKNILELRSTMREMKKEVDEIRDAVSHKHPEEK